MRVRTPKRPGLGGALDAGWLPLGPSGRVAGDHTPMVDVTVELGGLVLALQGSRGDADRA